MLSNMDLCFEVTFKELKSYLLAACVTRCKWLVSLVRDSEVSAQFRPARLVHSTLRKTTNPKQGLFTGCVV